MGRQSKQIRNLRGILKDKVSLIKAFLSFKRAAASVHVAVLRATSHGGSGAPPEHRMAAMLALGQGSRPTASLCVGAVMDRLHRTADAFVALKCLHALHRIASGGSFILRDQLSFRPSSGGRNFLNLSTFRDGRDMETWEISSWVRWYAGVLESNLMASRVLGTYISSKDRVEMKSLLDSDLIRDFGVLVGLVEEISRAPESLHHQRNNLVYEVVNLVGEDYRSAQRHMSVRLTELGERITGLSSEELAELSGLIKRVEDCRERLSELFVNKKKNDEFWDLVGRRRTEVAAAEEERAKAKWLVKLETSGSTRSGERVGQRSQLLRLPYGGDWMPLDRVHLTVRPAIDSNVTMVF